MGDVTASAIMEGAQLHAELVVAALQSHERLGAIETEYQAKVSAYWAEVQKNIDHGVWLATRRHDIELRERDDTIVELREEVARLSKALFRFKRRRPLKARKPKARK